MVLFKMGEAPTCTAGWPKTNIGYPNCDTDKGSEVAFHEPNLFTYCCPPIPCEITDISGVASRHLYRNNVPKPLGAHSYYSVMWDGHVRRGDPAQRQARREQEECDKIRQRLSLPRQSKSLAQRLAEKKAKARAAMATTPEEVVNREMARYSSLEISNLVPKDPTKYLVDLADEIDVLEPCYKGKRLPPLREFPIAPSRATNLVDVGTQVFGDTELFDFNGQAEPILARLIGAVVDQARLELLEEAELQSLLDQHALHVQRMQDARDAIARLTLREEKLRLEKERLAEERRKRENCEEDSCIYYEICAFSGTLTKDAINECIESLTKEGYLVSQMKAMMDQIFVPWSNDTVDKEVRRQNLSRDMLNYMIKEVVTNREAQYADAIWGSGGGYDEGNPFEKYGREGTVPPPTPGTSLLGESDGEEEEARMSENFND